MPADHAAREGVLWRADTDANLNARDKAWLCANADRIAGWHVMDAEELATFCEATPTRSLANELSSYITTRVGESFATHEGLVPAFREHILYSASRGIVPASADSEALFERFTDFVMRVFFNAELRRA